MQRSANKGCQDRDRSQQEFPARFGGIQYQRTTGERRDLAYCAVQKPRSSTVEDACVGIYANDKS